MELRVKEIYAGKLDARYEDLVLFENTNMILPPNLNMEDIIKGDKYYIIGNKGTGKTALLLYISNYLVKNDSDAICSTILFKSDYNKTERIRLESLERQLVDLLDVTSSHSVFMTDYTNLWKLTIYFKIVIDNKTNNYKIFENNTNWKAFENLILRLSNTAQIGTAEKLAITNSIPKVIEIDTQNGRIYTSEEQVLIPQQDDAIELINFNKALEIADYLFDRLERMTATYFICIDELETSYGNANFMRDLQMIHDWIEVVSIINEKIQKFKYKKTKIVLSVRSEMLYSIEKHLNADEINKKTMSYRILLDWKNKHGNNISNPLFLIWLKRIAKLMDDDTNPDYLQIRQNWFPPAIGTEDTIDFILNRTWQKPRDIVRFILLSVNAAGIEDTKFSKDLLLNVLEEYSRDSRTEIVEEMSAFYKSEQINLFFSSLKNFKIKFSEEEYERHIYEDYEGNEAFSNIDAVLADLYRFGVLGCLNVDNGTIKWNHQGESNLMKGAKWKYYVHPGLWYCLELEKLFYDNINIYDIKAVPLECTVTGSNESFAFVKFTFESRTHKGAIHVSDLSDEFIPDASQYVSTGQVITAYEDYFDERHKNWRLTCKIPR
ncbi:MAG: hypothetical protein HFI50_05095 [Lachnospiraceae bacterium]|jgi:hypothetical protein|nr:hypothetical protein [Lachnospiraceae bacterium]